MTFDFQSILVIGATSGIGWALAEKFLENGRKVVITGRRQDRLDQFISEHGGPSEKLSSYTFDITKLDEIPSWVTKVTSEHPDLDAVLCNSGLQRGFNFAKPETVDMSTIQTEITTNYISYISLTKEFLPFLMKKNSALIYTTSGLALVPIARCPNYCASKAALHHFLVSLRAHLKDTSVRVMELLPPAVQTELHDATHQPDIKDGRHLGMPLKDFTEETWEKFNRGMPNDEYPIQMAETWYNAIEPSRKKIVERMPQDPAKV